MQNQASSTLIPDLLEHFQRVMILFPREITFEEQARVEEIVKFWNRVDLRCMEEPVLRQGTDRVVVDLDTMNTRSHDLYTHEDMFQNLVTYFVEGTPPRKTKRMGEVGSRFSEGLGIAPVSITAIGMDGEELQTSRETDKQMVLRRYLENKLSPKDLQTTLYLASVV